MPAIEAAGLRKVYRSRFGSRKVNALKGIDLRVEPGEIFGLLGPNGAARKRSEISGPDLSRPLARRPLRIPSGPSESGARTVPAEDTAFPDPHGPGDP